MIGNEPKLTVLHILSVLPQDCGPEVHWAEPDGISKHIQRGPILIPDNSSVVDIHCIAPKRASGLRVACHSQRRPNKTFSRVAYERQAEFAAEIRRIGQRYFVQTPYKYFLIESHTWLPGVFVLLPRAWQIAVIDFLAGWRPKKTTSDWSFLTAREMAAFFPEAQIHRERSLGLTKSLLAIKAEV